jgi:hypothetical protein
MSQPNNQAVQPSADDLLAGGSSGRRARFGAQPGGSPVPGTVHKGIITDYGSKQQTTYVPNKPEESNKPMFYSDGKPAMELVITFQTEEREDPNDDGLRTVYAKGQLLAMIRQQIKEQGLPGVRNGGRIAMQFVEQELLPIRKNIFRVKYEPPAPASDDLFDTPSPTPQSVNHHGQAQSAEPPSLVDNRPAPAPGNMLEQMRDQAANGVPAAPVEENFDF